MPACVGAGESLVAFASHCAQAIHETARITVSDRVFGLYLHVTGWRNMLHMGYLLIFGPAEDLDVDFPLYVQKPEFKGRRRVALWVAKAVTD